MRHQGDKLTFGLVGILNGFVQLGIFDSHSRPIGQTLHKGNIFPVDFDILLGFQGDKPGDLPILLNGHGKLHAGRRPINRFFFGDVAGEYGTAVLHDFSHDGMIQSNQPIFAVLFFTSEHHEPQNLIVCGVAAIFIVALYFFKQANRATGSVGQGNGPVEREAEYLVQLQRAVQLLVNTLEKRQLLNTARQRLVGLGKEAGIINGNRRLIGKCDQQTQIIFLKHAAEKAIVYVNSAQRLPAHAQRRTHNGAQLIAHHALTSRKAVIFLGIAGQDALARVNGSLNDRMADIYGIGLDSFLIEVASRAGLQAAIFSIVQHQKAALGPGELDNRIHDLVEHFAQVQRFP